MIHLRIARTANMLFWSLLSLNLLPWTAALVCSNSHASPVAEGARCSHSYSHSSSPPPSCSSTALHAMGKPPGMEDANGRGSEGEFYFSQQRRLNLRLPDHAKKRTQRIPIFPKSNILMPLGDEYVGVFEMRYRQLLNTVGDSGVFGSLYFSSDYGKFALVGTLTKVKRVERVDDGGMYVLLEGVGRYYVKRFLKEKPYIEAEVQIFDDYTEDFDLLAHLESQILDEIRYSVKQMKVLYPSSNYTLSENVLRHRRHLDVPGMRTVSMTTQEEEISRMSKFSFATIEMLKTAPPQKLVLLQEPLLERRMNKVLKILKETTKYLEGELNFRGTYPVEKISDLREEALNDVSDLNKPVSVSKWAPETYKGGEWIPGPVMYD